MVIHVHVQWSRLHSQQFDDQFPSLHIPLGSCLQLCFHCWIHIHHPHLPSLQSLSLV
jgi:hypothetical protein